MSSSRSTAILMYHAVPRPDSQPPTWDPHYAVAEMSFREQLRTMRAIGLETCSVRDALQREDRGRLVCLTFDDGGSTDADVAVPLLLDSGARADFFVSAALVGKPGYVSWPQLADMARAGMSIQSHGLAHRLLNSLTDRDIENELGASKTMIEDRLGMPVELFAPPGGRLPQQAVRIARKLGYRRICGSRPGLWNGSRGYVLPRFAVLSGMTTAQVGARAGGDRAVVAKEVSRYALTLVAKKLLGNRRYEAMRSTLLR